MAEVTPTQGRYLAYIHAYTDGFGLPPAESEIAEAMGVSPPSVNQMMKTLERKGLIRRQSGVPRSIEVLVADDAIPKWKGKRITRTTREWTLASPTARRLGQASDGKAAVYRFKILLQDTDPVIWRRIETKDITLGKLHELIQTAMGWTNSHLHQFEIAGAKYTDSRFMMGDFDDFGAIDYSGIRIGDLASRHGSKLRMGYEYDFGDGWRHDVVLEKVTESEPGAKYPRCIDGERACPPEDVGGVYGFIDFVETITNPGHSEHRDYLEWHGPFDPRNLTRQKPLGACRKDCQRGEEGMKKPRKLAKSDRFPLIEKELHKRTKAELVAMILAIAREHAVIAREMEDRLTMEKPVDLLVADVSSAINRATDFDKRMMNHNFDVDWQAYADVQKGLSLLVELGHLADAKSLALKLMKGGSYQVECSDEGLMTDEINQCLKPVIRAVKSAGGSEAVQWAGDMQAADRVGLICNKELAELRSGS